MLQAVRVGDPRRDVDGATRAHARACHVVAPELRGAAYRARNAVPGLAKNSSEGSQRSADVKPHSASKFLSDKWWTVKTSQDRPRPDASAWARYSFRRLVLTGGHHPYARGSRGAQTAVEPAGLPRRRCPLTATGSTCAWASASTIRKPSGRRPVAGRGGRTASSFRTARASRLYRPLR